MFIRSFALRPAFLGSASLIALLISAQSGTANPDGGTVEAGTATIETTSPDTLLITQQTNKAIINWQNFDIGVNETTRFVLPGRNSVTLNRDFSGDPSEILGTLQSNGRFYLVNRSGILFGRNARVDVGGFVATTHGIRSDDFIAGRLEFNIPGDPGASVINYGSISINDYGVGAFVAPHVRNDGVIVANMGKVALASANGFTLDLHGDRLISFLIENPNDHQIYDANGNPISAFVENMGTIIADGGQVVLTASAARGVVDSVINTDGVIQANTVAQRGGKIILGGGTTGRVRTSGRIVARGNDAGEKGGEITIAGEKILADAFAVFDAAGRAGGGKFMLGGDYRGGNTTNDEIAHLGIELEDEPIQTAKLVVLEEGAQVDVSAIDEGDGGKLIVWSDEATFTAADLSARGGSISGNGGFIETSGKYLQVEKAADASAANGDAGTWLLDPLDITINHEVAANTDWWFNPSEAWTLFDGGTFNAHTFWPTDDGSIIAVELIEDIINLGVNVVITTYGTSGSDDGDIRLKADIDKTSGGDARLSLIAAGDIRIDSGVEVRSASGELTFELSAAEGRIRANNVGRMDMNGGELILVAKDGIDFTSRRDMPDHLSVLLNNTDLGSSRKSVDIEFDDDIVKFQYSAEVADFRPGALTLMDISSDGEVFIGFRTAVDGRLYDRAITGRSDRGWTVANFNSFGAIESNALNGIPEIEGYPDAYFDFLDQPSTGYVPVLEVSSRRDGTTDRYIVTAPAGHAILDDYLASLRPSTPVQEVVRAVEKVEEPLFIGPIQSLDPKESSSVHTRALENAINTLSMARDFKSAASNAKELLEVILALDEMNFTISQQFVELLEHGDISRSLRDRLASAEVDLKNITKTAAIGLLLEHIFEPTITDALSLHMEENIAESLSTTLTAMIEAGLTGGTSLPGFAFDQAVLIMESSLDVDRVNQELVAITLAGTQNVLDSYLDGKLPSELAMDHFRFTEKLSEDFAGFFDISGGQTDAENKMWIVSQLAIMKLQEGPESLPAGSLLMTGPTRKSVEVMDVAQGDGVLGQRFNEYRAFADAVAETFGLRTWEPLAP